tara:strand:+ start:176 stop:2464 length:2289 start_codon:yes stop_codon:yes gene_type:complete
METKGLEISTTLFIGLLLSGAKPGGNIMTISAIDFKARWLTFLEENFEYDITMILSGQRQNNVIDVNFLDLDIFDSSFAENLLHSPMEHLEAGSEALGELIRERGGVINSQLNIRVGELPKDSRVALREMGHIQINKLISTDVVITKVSEIKPRVIEAWFSCEACNNPILMKQDNETELVEPLSCSQSQGGCGATVGKRETRFSLIESKLKLINNQWIEIQELPENVPSGSQPGRGRVLVEGDLVNKHTPGERVTANMIPIIRSEYKRSKKTPMFDFVFRLVSSEYDSIPFNEIEISEEDKNKIFELSKRDDIFDIMMNSIAPSIISTGKMPYVKRSLALQLFGGVSRINADKTRMRGDIHILLMGDPGVAKSQLLEYMSKISPRGRFASGGGVSKAGLTAAVVRDAFNEGRFSLEAGIMPLSDRGLASIDEFDKISTEDKNVMHPAMEQQKIHISKGGLTATVPARCAVLAAANPESGKFDFMHDNAMSSMAYFKQTGLPAPLASRFDIIWLLRDEVHSHADESIALHILKNRTQAVSEHMIEDGLVMDPSDEEESLIFATSTDNKEYLTHNFLRKYIAYAKNNIFPELDKGAMDLIKNYYTDTRKKFKEFEKMIVNTEYGTGRKNKDEQAVPVTPRAIESVIRLTEAHARLHLRTTASKIDAKTAIAIHKHWMAEEDISERDLHNQVMLTSKSPSNRTRAMVRETIKNLHSEMGEVEISKIFEICEPKGIPIDVASEVISKMQTSGELFSPKPGYVQFVR